MSRFVPIYDLEVLSEEQRQQYVKDVCAHMGVPDALNLVMLTYLDDQEGPRRLVAYAKRGATEIIRGNRGINVIDLQSKEIGGSIVFTATGKDNTGRQEMSTGSKYIRDLVGRELDDAIMTAQTRATRRMTLQFVGAGVLDESEVNPSLVVKTPAVGMTAPIQPLVIPSTESGKDITEAKVVFVAPSVPATLPLHSGTTLEVRQTQEEFEARQQKLREDAISSLNAGVERPKGRRGRLPGSKNKSKAVDLGPSNPPVTEVPAIVETSIKAEPVIPPVVTVVPALPAPPVTIKTRLSQEQVKPFRQRLFKIVEQLEPAGFVPKEGMGNADKMRNLAIVMFPEVSNMTELTEEQWEKYLSKLEKLIEAQGAAATVKYIEDTIGL